MSLLMKMKRNNIIEQLKMFNVTEWEGKSIYDMEYSSLVMALTLTKIKEDEDVDVESSENEWF